MRDIPPTWSIALATSAATVVLIWLGMNRLGWLSWLANRAIYFFAGALIGFMTLAIPPALPVLALIGGYLGIRATHEGRTVDAALMLCGFGAQWTVLLGWGILNDLADPAVQGSPETVAWFLVGAVLLVAGLTTLIGLTIRRHA